MKLKTIKLQNFRNYKTLNIKLDENTNIFYGDNAQGKTNILEAVSIATTTKSHRNAKDRELIRFEGEEAHIEIKLEKKNLEYVVDVHLKKNSPKGIAINKMPIKRASQLFGIVNIVFFSPEDLNIIKNGPAERRKFIDLELSQLNKLYLNDLVNYNKVIMQRNKLLKSNINKQDLLVNLNIWDEQLEIYGRKIIQQRSKFIEQTNQIIKDIHFELSDNKESLELKYEKNVEEHNFQKVLKKYRDRDIQMRCTTVGPHKDDMGMYINNFDIRKFGSQGQQRTAALSLKLAEIELVKEVINDTPILLLDDVLSELDQNRQHILLDKIGGIQTLVSCTGVEEFIKHRFNINKIFCVKNGNILTNIKEN